MAEGVWNSLAQLDLRGALFPIPLFLNIPSNYA